MGYFPFFIDITDKKFLVVGAGKVARRKAHRLLECGADVKVVALTGEIEGAFLTRKAFETSDLQGVDYVIAATDDEKVNQLIAREAKERGILVDSVEGREESDFIFPSLVRRGDLVIGISSSGKSPGLSHYVRERIEDELPEQIDEVMEQLDLYRRQLKDQQIPQQARAKQMKEKLNQLIEGMSET